MTHAPKRPRKPAHCIWTVWPGRTPKPAPAPSEDSDGTESPAYLYWVDAGELLSRNHVSTPSFTAPCAQYLLREVLSEYDATRTREMALLSHLACRRPCRRRRGQCHRPAFPGIVGIAWPPNRAPIALAVLSTRQRQDAEAVDPLIAKATALAVEALS
ncbi:hypothetical protein SANTM175S_00750 [Streptomyces antimycoticus]